MNPPTVGPLELLDCTLRDGGYRIGFGFTASDTKVIGRALENAGVRWIEIGHGVGLNASEKGYGRAAETDEGYLIAAAETLKSARFGVFCIPGIAELEHVDMGADHGMGFIRIGANVDETQRAQSFIERAKTRGLFVSANIMKSYAMPPKQFAEVALRCAEYGADVLCIVDSAGGMLPGQVKEYFDAVRSVSDIRIGFHGHNNLGLAVSNSLSAIDWGASFLDTTLQGMGRSAGNAPTERVVAALLRMGIDTGIDLMRLLDAGEQLILPLLHGGGIGSLETITGYAQFHSSYMGIVQRIAGKHSIDPRLLIIAVCERDRVNCDPGMVEEIASGMTSQPGGIQISRFGFAEYFGDEQR